MPNLNLILLIYFKPLIIFLASFIFLLISKKILILKFNKKTFVSAISIWNWPSQLAISLYLSSWFLELAGPITNILNKLILIILAWYLTLSLQQLLNFGFQKYLKQKKQAQENFDETIILLFKQITKILLWLLAIIILLQNLGFELSALLGGLGIGGIAIAFAVQNILEDVFSSISIYFDKPFKVGDFIVIDDDSGTVKKIGIKSTRLNTLQGEELIISNKEITQARVQNFKKLKKRRVVFEFGVEYETLPEKLTKIPQILKEILAKLETVEFKRCHLKTLGDSSLIYELVYLVENSDYEVYMDLQQEINLKLLSAFKEKKINFAYPVTRMVK